MLFHLSVYYWGCRSSFIILPKYLSSACLQTLVAMLGNAHSFNLLKVMRRLADFLVMAIIHLWKGINIVFL